MNRFVHAATLMTPWKRRSEGMKEDGFLQRVEAQLCTLRTEHERNHASPWKEHPLSLCEPTTPTRSVVCIQNKGPKNLDTVYFVPSGTPVTLSMPG